MYRVTLCLVPMILLALLGGCASQPSAHPMSNSYYLYPYKNLNTLGRVALVELDNDSGHPDISADVTQALFVALQKKQIFGLTVIGREDPAWRPLQENPDSLQALKKLLAMRDTLKCNGLLVGTITEYQPYPRMTIGLRLKLIDLTDGQLLWGLEQVWDTADHSIEKRIEQYFKDELRSGVASLREELVVISSLRFSKFVAYEVAGTFDPSEE
ncbi:MAG: hypothetical protein ACYTAS_14000 [Planctomycetota bacterium]